MEFPTKKICGYDHYHRLCVKCNEMVWTQHTGDPEYICNTCRLSSPKFSGSDLKITPIPRPPSSEDRYNGKKHPNNG